jgi:hypothetical protein
LLTSAAVTGEPTVSPSRPFTNACAAEHAPPSNDTDIASGTGKDQPCRRHAP